MPASLVVLTHGHAVAKSENSLFISCLQSTDIYIYINDSQGMKKPLLGDAFEHFLLVNPSHQQCHTTCNCILTDHEVNHQSFKAFWFALHYGSLFWLQYYAVYNYMTSRLAIALYLLVLHWSLGFWHQEHSTSNHPLLYFNTTSVY